MEVPCSLQDLSHIIIYPVTAQVLQNQRRLSNNCTYSATLPIVSAKLLMALDHLVTCFEPAMVKGQNDDQLMMFV